jgi:hypothetical protein
MICKGDKTQFCGAGGKLSLWSFDGQVPSTYTPPDPSGGNNGGGGTTTPPTAGDVNATDYTYLGCYSDKTNPRALPADFNDDGTRNSVNFCALRAQSLNYKYFGLEYGSQCLLGDALDKASTLLAETSCNVACKKGGKTCGGSQAMSVYTNDVYVDRIPKTVTLAAQGVNWNYKGCYAKGSGGALAGGYLLSDTSVSVDTCAALCVSKGYQWMGLEYGKECSCNNNGIQGGAAIAANGDADCSMKCAGKGTQNCGNARRVQIYQRGSAGNSRIVKGSRRRNVFGEEKEKK